MRGISLLLAATLLTAQTNPVADGIAAFQRGDYKTARANFERAPADPRARLFLAFIGAATGKCDSVIPELARGFSGAENRRLAGVALAQCHVSGKRFAEAGAIIAQLEKEQMAAVAAKRQLPHFSPGDTVIVNVKVVEGDRTRVQAYEGVCIGRSEIGRASCRERVCLAV